MSTILLTDRAWPDDTIERTLIEGAGHVLVAGPPTASDAAGIAALCVRHRPDAIMTCWAPVDAAAIAASPALRIVARMGVGLDNIAIAAASEAKAWVTNVPDYCVEDVSDHALALIFAWARGVALLNAQVKRGSWNPSGIALRRMNTLTAGILGYGRIGRRTAAKLAALGLRVLASDVSATSGGPAQMVSREVLLAESDAVVLHVPLLPSTHHLVDRAFLSQMKPGALLVNVSRGPLVDSDALLEALNSRHLSAAGLDVVEGEPAPPATLVGRDDVIATPHVAFSSVTSVAELRRRATEEVLRVLAGEQPQFPCNVL